MDPFKNPFSPGAGSIPPELAGRQQVLSMAEASCARSISGRSARSLMMLGLRGTGKTVLIGEMRRIGEQRGLLVTQIEAPEGDSLGRMLLPAMHKVLRSLSTIEDAKHVVDRGLRALRSFASVFKLETGGVTISVEPEPGLADSGDIEYDLPDLFEEIGRAAQAAGKGWLLLIDEVQYLSPGDLSALIVALHRASQRGLPIVFGGAGLPQVARLAGDAKSYAERLFHYPAIGALAADAAEDAVRKPIASEGALITDDALQVIVQQTYGYPFFLQEWGSFAWNTASGNEITLADAKASYDETIASLDNGFFKVRMDRLTQAEVKFVNAMASLGTGPYPIAEIARVLERKQSSLSPTRKNIISKGMIYSTDHGHLDFTVPLFSAFLDRQSIVS